MSEYEEDKEETQKPQQMQIDSTAKVLGEKVSWKQHVPYQTVDPKTLEEFFRSKDEL